MPPLPQFAGAAASLGHVWTIPDRDGVTRYEYLAVRYGDGRDYYPSLGLEVARINLGIPRDHMSLTLGEGVRLDKILIPTDQKARMLINSVGEEQKFTYISAGDVIRGLVPKGTFTGKAVFVGTSALAAYDQKTTPFSANFPGVEKMRALPGATLAAAIFSGMPPSRSTCSRTWGSWFTITVVFVAVTVLRFMTEEKQATEVRAMFSSYVSPRIVEELIKDPAKAKLGGQRKELTAKKERHIMDALSEVGLSDPGLMRAVEAVGDALFVDWRRAAYREEPDGAIVS